MNRISLALVTLVAIPALASIPACAVDAQPDGTENDITPNTDTDVTAMAANDVTHTYYSDATYTHVVGEVEVGVNCGVGKRSWGTLNTHWYSVDTVPCNHGFATVQCMEWQAFSIDQQTGEADGDFYAVTCPPDITFTVGY